MSKSSDQDQALIAAFLARKGVTKIAEGVRAMSAREVWERTQGDRFEQRRIDERHVIIGADGREHVRNGLGEWIS